MPYNEQRTVCFKVQSNRTFSATLCVPSTTSAANWFLTPMAGMLTSRLISSLAGEAPACQRVQHSCLELAAAVCAVVPYTLCCSVLPPSNPQHTLCQAHTPCAGRPNPRAYHILHTHLLRRW